MSNVSKPTISLVFRRRRLGHRACGVPTCPHPRSQRGLGLSAWCQDHTDAIWAGTDSEGYSLQHGQHRHDAAVRLGARRWLLRAEVDAALERSSAAVLERILEMSPHDRAVPMNRSCWDTGAVKLSARVDELTELGLCDPPARCPDGTWHKDGSRRCRLTLYHKGPHEYEAVAT